MAARYEGCRYFEEEAGFQDWFVRCVIAGAQNKDCPNEYVWNMIEQSEKGGEWLEMYRSGLTAEAAVNVKFRGLKLNS